MILRLGPHFFIYWPQYASAFGQISSHLGRSDSGNVVLQSLPPLGVRVRMSVCVLKDYQHDVSARCSLSLSISSLYLSVPLSGFLIDFHCPRLWGDRDKYRT